MQGVKGSMGLPSGLCSVGWGKGCAAVAIGQKNCVVPSVREDRFYMVVAPVGVPIMRRAALHWKKARNRQTGQIGTGGHDFAGFAGQFPQNILWAACVKRCRHRYSRQISKADRKAAEPIDEQV